MVALYMYHDTAYFLAPCSGLMLTGLNAIMRLTGSGKTMYGLRVFLCLWNLHLYTAYKCEQNPFELTT